jgi:hypothetical protein
MRQFGRVLAAEWLKLRRTLAFRLAVIAPLLIVLLQFTVELARGQKLAHEEDPLRGFAQGILTFWTIILLPFCAALEAALLAALEHQGDNWKHLLALAIPRIFVFAAKWIAAAGLLLLSSLVLLAACCAATGLLREVRPGWSPAPLPVMMIARGVLLSLCATNLLLSLQMWISLRWRGFIPGLATGVIALVVNIIILPGGMFAANFFPWSLPAVAMAPVSPHRALGVAWGLCGGIVLGATACWDLSRREFQQ